MPLLASLRVLSAGISGGSLDFSELHSRESGWWDGPRQPVKQVPQNLKLQELFGTTFLKAKPTMVQNHDINVANLFPFNFDKDSATKKKLHNPSVTTLYVLHSINLFTVACNLQLKAYKLALHLHIGERRCYEVGNVQTTLKSRERTNPNP